MRGRLQSRARRATPMSDAATSLARIRTPSDRRALTEPMFSTGPLLTRGLMGASRAEPYDVDVEPVCGHPPADVDTSLLERWQLLAQIPHPAEHVQLCFICTGVESDAVAVQQLWKSSGIS
ncbi:unnamed protein product [Lampetra planeri]